MSIRPLAVAATFTPPGVIEHAEGFSCVLGGGARVLFSSRAHGNLSTQRGERAYAGREARDGLCQAFALEWLCASRQVHGTDVQLVRERAGRGGEAVAIDADGHATALRGIGVAVLSADCLPVALAAGGEQPVVAVVHAGWRGLAAGVLEQGAQALRELGASGEIEAAIGPGAGACCYEVGPEVHAAFGERQQIGRSGERARIDLRAIARERLLAAGVARVHEADACTICDERFFSHRRQGEQAGRQAGVAWLS
ncbi:MAG TPA: polyphenol oxidase family protein [Solirubrobacteraceae bacterium]|nr:polyphenol oxidase family protein [Solirubrobacteraceae bacterium]